MKTTIRKHHSEYRGIRRRRRLTLWALWALIAALLLGNIVSLAEEAVPDPVVAESQTGAWPDAEDAEVAAAEIALPETPEDEAEDEAAPAPADDVEVVSAELVPAEDAKDAQHFYLPEKKKK